MKIASESFEHGKRIPAEFAAGTPDGFGGNRNPHLHWRDAPAGTRSFALLCIDPDAPTDPALVQDDSRPIPVEHPRGDFVHWVMADIPAGVDTIAAGACSEGFTARGKTAPAGVRRSHPNTAGVGKDVEHRLAGGFLHHAPAPGAHVQRLAPMRRP